MTLDGADRFRFEVLAATGSVRIRVSVDTTASSGLFAVGLFDVSAAGTYDVFFGATDVTSVDAITFETSADLLSAGGGGGDSVTFGSFFTVPEPSTALLLGIGLVGFAVRRRHLN